MPKTKIIATLGPASSTSNVLRKMMLAGLDVARLNFSHGSHQDKIKHITLIRELNRKYRRKIRILGDLEGYRIRIGKLHKPVEIKRNETLLLVPGETGHKAGVIPFDYTGSLDDIHDGHEIFIDDGKLALVVEGRDRRGLKTRVTAGGLLKEHKGINIPAACLRFTGLTEKDKADLIFCRDNEVDFVAQSFVRTRDDIQIIRDFLGSDRPALVAKIENRQGVHNVREIMTACEGIMIARGDLGVSLPIYEVPLIQKEIIRLCRRRGDIFAVTATQMLESMIQNKRPTRAEVSDVANAIIDGSEYLMLSAETAVGDYPVETVRMMNQIIEFTESYLKSAKAIKGVLA